MPERKVATARLPAYLGKRPQSRVILETCAEAFFVADAASALGHQVRVVPATLVRQLGVGERGIKTDERDARKRLAEASSGYLYGALVSAARSAGDYTVRVVPHFDGVAVPLEDAGILWQRQSVPPPMAPDLRNEM